MAASQPGSSSSAQIADNRIFLFRLQMLIIDGGLTSLRNFVAQELAAQSSTLSACLAYEKAQINLLKGRKIITQVQYDLLYPPSGTVSTSDLDITLIICLMRNLKCFKLNTQFNWNISPGKNDTSIEADICRLKFFRNEISHISTTTGILHNDFIQKWNEIEQILLRIDKVYPIKDFQQTITDFQFCTLDPSTEKRVTDEIEKWNKFDKSVETDLEHLKTCQKVMKQTIEAQNIELAETRKYTSENTEELKTVNVKIAEIENQLTTVDKYQQRKLGRGNATQAKKRKAGELYQDKKKRALVALERKKTLQNDGNVVVTAKWVLRSNDGDDRKLDMFDNMFIALFKERKECSLDEHEYEALLEKLRDLVSYIEQTTGAKADDAETSCVIVKFICRTNKHIQNLLEYFDSDDLECRLKKIANLISLHAKKQVNLSFTISDESLDSILQTEVAGKTEEVKKTSLSEKIKDQMKETGSEPDSHISSTEDTYLIRPEAGTELDSHISSTEDTYLIRKEVIVVAKWTLKSAHDDERIPDTFDKIFIAVVKGKECFRDEHAHEVFEEKVRDLVSHIEQTTGAKANDAETSCVNVKFICRTNKHIKNLLEYFDSDDLIYRLNEIANLISLHAKKQVNLSFRISDESLDSIIQTEVAEKTEEVPETSFSETIKDQKNKAGTELHSHISSTEDTYLIRKEELKERLIVFNKYRHSIIFLPPPFEKDYTPLASFYIRPELNVNTLQDMFKSGGVANQEIYLKADAGLGKTTFSKYLATAWCQAHWPNNNDVPYFENNDIYCMRDFDFVFLVLLRNSNTSCSVDELIFQLIVSKLANSKSITDEFMQELLSREKCLVILDGLDEWTHPNTQCDKIPRSIPHRNYVGEHCTILTTTRPWKLGDLNLSSNELGKTVELTKLSRDSAVTLVARTLLRLKSPPHNMSIKINDATFVNEILNSRVAHLAYVPLLLMYMIFLRCEGFKIGNSKCELYVKIVELLLLRTTQKYGDIPQTLSSGDVPACFTEHDKCKEYFPLLVKLGHLAYHTLSNETRENTLLFDGSVTEKYLTPAEMKFTLHSGILSQSTTTNLIKKVSKVSFFHKKVQEFFAAILISSHSDAQKIVLEKCRNIQEILDMSEIWKFIIEINADRMFAISNDLMSVINEDEETRDYRTRTGSEGLVYNTPLYNIQKMFMSCLQEIPESENIRLCLQDFFIDDNTVYSGQLQRLLKQNKTNMKSLYINNRHTSVRLCEIIDLFSPKYLSHTQKLYYRGDGMEAEINWIFVPSVLNVTLRHVTSTIDEENLSENLARVQNLQYLFISNFTLSNKILETFFNFISGHKSLKELTLKVLYCEEHGGHDCKSLNLDLSQHSTLSDLYLRELPTRLQLNITTPSLVNVTLQGINLDESSVLLSGDMLNIERVELNQIEMSAGSLQNFIIVLESLPKSVTVKMQDVRPETEYGSVKEIIRRSQTFHVIRDCKEWYGLVIEFQTRKSS